MYIPSILIGLKSKRTELVSVTHARTTRVLPVPAGP